MLICACLSVFIEDILHKSCLTSQLFVTGIIVTCVHSWVLDIICSGFSNKLIYFRYPVILSVENHCSIEQQKKMANYVKTIFGGILFIE